MWKKWLHGLVAAFIGGGAGAVSAGFAASYQDPAHFNMGSGFLHMLELMGAVFLVTGILNAAAYLKQSPVPPEWDGVNRRQ